MTLKDWENSLARIALPPNSGNAHLRGILCLLPVLDLGIKHALCALVLAFPVLMLTLLVTTRRSHSRNPSHESPTCPRGELSYAAPCNPSRASGSHL